jgi:asparagine synthetase B (glutamine-hydrolysing)
MCGIAGCLALALDETPDKEWVSTATERITHRGPDDDGYYADPDVALGYKRLAIIDLSPGGHQPMRSADGRYWMVFNGEIYNYLELGAELREQGVELRTSSDSEVLLETYARVGKDVVHRLRGMYAFAIWDTWTRELFCARDPFGIKPFYYRVDRGPADAGPKAAATPRAAGRGGRHAGPASKDEPPRTGPDPAEEADWFTPSSQRRGRHAAAPDPSGNGQLVLAGAVPGGPAPAAPAAPVGAPAAAGWAAGTPGPQQAGQPADLEWTERHLRFASERKALAEPGELHALDPASLRRYLAFQYVPAPDTVTPPVQVLPPGHALIARPGGSIDVYRYWRAVLRPARAPSDTTAKSILSVMRDSVAFHLRSDAPLGAFLSGGIDSAAICALAAEHRPDLLTFTVGFEREGYSEIDRAQETAAALGVKSIPYVITQEEFFRHLPQVI